MKKIILLTFSLFCIFSTSVYADSNLDVNLSVDVDSNFDYVDNGIGVNIGQTLNYKVNFCNISGSDISPMFRLHSTLGSNLEFVSNSLYLDAISLPDGVFGTDLSVGNMVNGSCRDIFFALKPKQGGLLKTNDNVDYIAKYKYGAMLTYLDSNTIGNPVSPVPVSMTISGPNSWTGSTQNITANINEGIISYSLLDVGNNTCDNSVTFSNTYTGSLTFSSEVDNGKKVCFRGDNGFGSLTYSLSNELKLKTSAPAYILHNPIDIFSNSQTFSADITDPTGFGSDYLVFTGTCDQTSFFNEMMSGNFPISYTSGSGLTFSSEADNGKKVCFRAYDFYGNSVYFTSNTIKIDNTAPVINTSTGLLTQSNNDIYFEIIANLTEVNSGSILYSLLDVGNNTCDNSVTLSNTYTGSLTFSSEADNGKKVCFKALDEANNIDYKLVEIVGIYKAPVVVVTPVIQSSGGGGGVSLRKDTCPGGDYSASYYDKICGEKPNISITQKVFLNSLDPLLTIKAKVLVNTKNYSIKNNLTKDQMRDILSKLRDKVVNEKINYKTLNTKELEEIFLYVLFNF